MARHNLYSEHADAIEAVLAYTRRAHRLSADDGDEFSSWARLRLLEDDCAILRKFQGLSSIKTFLVTVIQRLFLDWRNKEWGKWRPTMEARRIGRVAIELERLVLRDGIDYGQASQLLASKGIAASIAECDEVWGRLKRGGGRHFVGEETLDYLTAVEAVDLIDAQQRQRLAEQVVRAVHEALAQLPPGDHLIFKLRYWDRVSVATIARLQQVEQKPLYRRFEQLHQRIRKDLAARGIAEAEIRGLFDGFGVDVEDSGAGGAK